MPKLDSLEPVMIEELRDLLDAEKQVTKALPKMAKAASSEQLKAAFEQHLEQTNRQLERLNQVFDRIGEAPRPKKCTAIQSIIEEGQQMLDEAEEGPTRDALLIAAAQKVEHYEMAAYGTVRTHASLLGESEAADLLEQTLDEEKETDRRLTEIAESVSNPQAVRAGRDPESRRQSPGARGKVPPDRLMGSGSSRERMPGRENMRGHASGGPKAGGRKRGR
jgi:ferritin-like metal-binding protein YciE